jgi:nicotinate-nucleotide adenylyltransferase
MMKALFGGTFNPIHNGHIALARQVCEAFALHTVEFIPSFHSVHRAQPETAPALREQMLRLALQPYPELTLNNCELQRQGRSFTVDTLRAIKQANPRQSLCWLMGADSFNGFGDWHRPDEILRLANLIVCTRPGVELNTRGRFAGQVLAAGEKLADFDAGKIAVFKMSPNSCSSTRIRQQLAGGETAADCLPSAVLEFIHQHNLYK